LIDLFGELTEGSHIIMENNGDWFYDKLIYEAIEAFPTDDPRLLKDLLTSVCGASPNLNELVGAQIEDLITEPASRDKAAVLSKVLHFVYATVELRPILYEYFANYCSSRASDFIEQFADSEDRKILFVAHIPYFQIARESIALRKLGYKTFLIHAEDANPSADQFRAKCFDGQIALPANIFLFQNVIKHCSPELIHLQVGAFELEFPISRFIAENKGTAHCVASFYDVLSNWCEYDDLKRETPELADFSFETEKSVAANSAAATFRYHPSAIKEFQTFHSIKMEIIEFHPYPMPDFIEYSTDKYSHQDGITRLVYAGRVVKLDPDGSFSWPLLRIGGYLIGTFRRITAQGIALDFFMDPNFDIRKKEGYELYQEMDMMDDLFALRRGLLPDKFANAINRHDFGFNMIAVDIEKLANNRALFLNVGTKNFTYLEAGLPVIVNREWTHTSDIIEENGLGISIHHYEIDQLSEIIAKFDYDQAVENIQKYNTDNSLYNRIETLSGLYERILPEWKRKD
jgi:hypothetical protein